MNLRQVHYGWIIVASGFIILATNSILIYAFGVFLKPLAAEFGWDRGAISGAFSTQMIFSGILGIFWGRLCDRHGPRLIVTAGGLIIGTGFLLMSLIDSLWQVYLFCGFLIGLGNSCCLVPVISTIPRWFNKKRGIAIGICAAGYGLGSTITPLLVQWLIFNYGWRQGFFFLGLIAYACVMPAAQFMKKDPQQIGLLPYEYKGKKRLAQSKNLYTDSISFRQAIKTSCFWLYCLTQILFWFCCVLVIVHIVPYITDIGISEIIATSILAIIAGTGIIGRLFMGIIADKIGARLVLSICIILAAISITSLLFITEIWMLYIFAVMFGIICGSAVPMETMVPLELFGVKFLGTILATIMVFTTSGGALGPFLAGLIFDITASYNLAFIICFVLLTLAFIFSLFLISCRPSAIMGHR